MEMIHRKRKTKRREKNLRHLTKKWNDEEEKKKGVINTEVSFEVVIE